MKTTVEQPKQKLTRQCPCEVIAVTSIDLVTENGDNADNLIDEYYISSKSRECQILVTY